MYIDIEEKNVKYNFEIKYAALYGLIFFTMSNTLNWQLIYQQTTAKII